MTSWSSSGGTWRTLAIGALVGLVAATGCASNQDAVSMDSEAAAPTSTVSDDTASPEPGALVDVFVDPRDDTHLLLRLAYCVTDATPSAVETASEVRISVTSRPADPPCEQDLVDLYLDDPLMSRRVVDAAHLTEMPVQAASFLYPDASDVAVAECTTEAARAAVAADIDGGLRSDILACDGTWMAVATSSNACPATGEPVDDGCIANEHTAYFRNVDGKWAIVGFACDVVRDMHPDLPDEICQD